MTRMWIMPAEVKVGDVLPDPHFSGRSGVVTKVTPAWYGCSISYEYDGDSCVSAVFDHDVGPPIASRHIRAGIEVER